VKLTRSNDRVKIWLTMARCQSCSN